MNKSKLTGLLFVVLGVLVILGASYVIISYLSDILTAIVDFVTTNDLTKIQQCGINVPPQFQKLRAELTTIILPSLYIGLPVMLIILSFLMFLGGFYYHRGRYEDEVKKIETMEREMLRKAVTKLEKETPSSEIGMAEEVGEETETEEPMEEETEEAPQRRKTKKKK
jgi:hypothetical protein